MKSWIRRFSLALAAWCLIGLVASPVFAARSKRKQAAALSRRAIKLYQRGEYQRAAALFLEAFELSKKAVQLRNAAKAYEEGDLLEKAEPLWERYLEQDGLSLDERNEAKAHLKLIRERRKNREITAAAEDLRAAAERARKEAQAARLAAEAAATKVDQARPATAVTTRPSEPAPPLGGYLLLGGGIASLAAGAVLWFVASGQLTEVDDRLDTRNDAGLIVGITPGELDDELSSINTKRVTSGVLVSVGFAAAAGGVAWLLLEAEGDASIAAAPTPGGAAVAVTGRF